MNSSSSEPHSGHFLPELGVVDPAPSAAAAGLWRLEPGFRRGIACRGLHVVEQRQLVGDHLLGSAAEEALVGEPRQFDQPVALGPDGGELVAQFALQIGRRQGRLGGVAGEAGVVGGQPLVVARERLDLRQKAGDLLCGRYVHLILHGHIIPYNRRSNSAFRSDDASGGDRRYGLRKLCGQPFQQPEQLAALQLRQQFAAFIAAAMSDSAEPAGMANSTRPTSARMGRPEAVSPPTHAGPAGAASPAGTMALASAMPAAVTFIQLDVPLDLRGNLPGSSSLKRVTHL